ncbi:MAG: DinB family protein [Candidatus Heimdallarchaeaceae archaeon]
MSGKDTIKPDSLLFKIPTEGIRPLGEVLLHMIRSLEFYMVGIMNNHWEALPYNLMELNTIPEIILLYENVADKITKYVKNLSLDKLNEKVSNFNKPATKADLILEMLEHSIHHRGQLSVYFRLLKIEPPKIQYII